MRTGGGGSSEEEEKRGGRGGGEQWGAERYGQPALPACL